MAKVAERYADATTNAIASSAVPVKDLKHDLSDGWSLHYSPLALLAWTAERSAHELKNALDVLRSQPVSLSSQHTFEHGLAQVFGRQNAQSLLGVPSASSFEFNSENGELSLTGQRRQWLNGGWQPISTPVIPRRVFHHNGRIQLGKQNKSNTQPDESDTHPVLVLDTWPAYQPSGLSVQQDH